MRRDGGGERGEKGTRRGKRAEGGRDSEVGRTISAERLSYRSSSRSKYIRGALECSRGSCACNLSLYSGNI